MATAATVSRRVVRQDCFKATERHSPIVFSERSLKFQHTKINMLRHQTFTNGKVQRKLLRQAPLAMDSSDIIISSPSPSTTIMQFYTSINEKNLKQLEELLSDDCFFEDYSFPKPFDGKQVTFGTFASYNLLI